MKDTDFRLDGLEPADEQSATIHARTWICRYQTISQHDVGARSFIVAFDPSATWDVPNTPNLFSFDVVRDTERGTFSMHSSGHATLAFAQRWLIDRGCPADTLAPIIDTPRPADELTVRVEDRIRHSGERLAIVEHQVIDGSEVEGWSIAVDHQAKELPVRLFLESLQPEQYTYTVREGAFADWDAVDAWLEDRSTPLPEAPEYRFDAEALRTGAALSRTTSSLPQVGTDPGTPAVPVNSPRSFGRSL